MLKTLYFCEKCRKQIEKVSDLHFVEDNSNRGFCGEKCIKDFYRPYMSQLEMEESSFRVELNISIDEDYIEIVGNEKILEKALSAPDESWCLENELGQKFHTHILELESAGKPIYYILICSYIENEPSFVFYRTATEHKVLKDKYCRDYKYSTTDYDKNEQVMVPDEHGEEYEIPADIIELLEHKKSQFLATLMEQHSPGDIGIEDYLSYDKYLEQTIENPDEIYEYEDDEGDVLNNFIKSFKMGDISFFYVVILYPYKLEKIREVAVLPILGFPSVDKDLYPKYTTGKRLNEKLTN